MVFKGINLLHNNRFYVVTVCTDFLLRFRYKIMEHFLQTPDFSSCHYHAFGQHKKALTRRLLRNNNEVRAVVEEWFALAPPPLPISSINVFTTLWTSGKHVSTFTENTFSRMSLFILNAQKIIPLNRLPNRQQSHFHFGDSVILLFILSLI